MEAVETVEEDMIDLTVAQKSALDKELQALNDNPDYLLKWNDIKHRFIKH